MTRTRTRPVDRPTQPGAGRAADVSFSSVVHVNEKGGNFGGTEEYIALVTAGLAESGVRSSMVCGVVSGPLPPELDAVHLVPGLASRAPQPGTAAALAEVVAALDPDVIYVHNVFDPEVVGALAGIEGRGALLWYVHDHYVTCLSELRWRRDVGACPHRLGTGCLAAIGAGQCVLRYPDRSATAAELERRLALSRSLAAADAVIVVSEYMRGLVGEVAPDVDERLHLLSRPIRGGGKERQRHREDPHEHAVVTYAGRITAEKGLAVVIAALGTVRSACSVELRVAGVVESGDYWAHCQALLAAATVENPRLSSTFLGALDYAAIDELFRQSDIVVIPSQWPEPLGAVALEAMAAGAAVIASGVGGLRDILRHDHNGIHVAGRDVASWATALTDLFEHPDRARRLGRQAQRDRAGIAIAGHLHDLDDLAAPFRHR